MNKENKVPTFSLGFKDTKMEDALPVPETKEEYLKILKDKFGFN